jgi:hypothetical protein
MLSNSANAPPNASFSGESLRPGALSGSAASNSEHENETESRIDEVGEIEVARHAFGAASGEKAVTCWCQTKPFDPASAARRETKLEMDSLVGCKAHRHRLSPKRFRVPFIEVFIEWRQESIARFLLHKGRVAAHTKPGFDTGAHKPRPDSSLMIAAVALDSIARFIWPKATQPFGSQQRSFDDIHDGASRFLFEATEGQAADGENLGLDAGWRPKRRAGGHSRLHQETTPHLIPESGSKGLQA